MQDYDFRYHKKKNGYVMYTVEQYVTLDSR